MDLSLDAELAAFRDEVNAFLAVEMTPQLRAELDVQEAAESNWSPSFSKRLAERGWLSMTWPSTYGGADKPLVYLAVLNEQLGRWLAPIGWHNIATEWVAMPLLEFGTEEQKRRLLPPIARADDCFGPAFTEPETGSDLAAITTRAVRDGADYVIDGIKVFSTEAHRANHLWLLAVTDPRGARHRNLSVFIVDTAAAGLTVKGVKTINHGRVNTVYLDGVRVPAQNRVGPENEGWRVAMSTLNIERSGMYYAAASQALLADLVLFCRESVRGGAPLFDREWIRRGLAAWAVEFEAQHALSERVVWLQSSGESPSVEPSVQSLRMRMAQHPFADFAMDVLGLAGQLPPGSEWAPLRGRIERLYLTSCSQHSGGTTEIQKNVIAMRGLGLPRS